MARKHPLIGITTGRLFDKSKPSTFALGEAYSRAVLKAGGIPVIVPMGMPDHTAKSILSELDGIIFSGGGDVAPEFYNHTPDDRIHLIDRDRDRVETLLVIEAVQNKIPFLGICRGIQIINAALGGTLYPDVLEDHPGAHKHDYYPDWSRDYYAHTVRVESNTILASVVGIDELPVNSLHHQGIQTIAENLIPVAWAEDALIEACQCKDHPFGLAVQWHPECLPDDTKMQKIFSAFITAASQR